MRHLGLFVIAFLLPPGLAPQQKPLERAFTPGNVAAYRVHLTVRSEVEGERPMKIGVHTYAVPFRQAAEVLLSWRATRRVVRVTPEGIAEIEEMLDEIKLESRAAPPEENDEQRKLRAALHEVAHGWSAPGTRALRYRETPQGQLTGVGRDAAPLLDDAPPVLTLWLRRALRPTVVLPSRAVRAGDRWQEPRSVALPPWAGVQGSETGEWLPGPMPERSVVKLVNLHTTQQISGRVPPRDATGQDALPEAQGRFHAESVTSLVHAGAPLYGGYGHLHSANRSAIREVTQMVGPVPGLKHPPRFRSRTSVQVQISVLE